MKLIRNFNDFRKKRLNEELTPFAGDIQDNLGIANQEDNLINQEDNHDEELEEREQEIQDDIQGETDFDEEELSTGFSVGEEDLDPEDLENSIADRQEMSSDVDHEEEEEQEGGEYIGQRLMNELGEMLDAPVINNTLSYAGKKVNFFSETEKFHVDSEQFDTPEEVYDYLMGTSPSSEEIANTSEIEPLEEPIGESKSYRSQALRRAKK